MMNAEARGQWLREQRERRKMSVRQLAARLDVATAVIYDWQNGKTGVSDENAAKLAEVFDMDVVQVRRHLGLWTPDESGDGTGPDLPADAGDRLAQLREQLDAALAMLDEIERQQRRSG